MLTADVPVPEPARMPHREGQDGAGILEDGFNHHLPVASIADLMSVSIC
jgi:hypothetical protein